MLAQTPPMGWNSWNTFGRKLDERLVRETADTFVKEGLKDAGYEYIVMDDFWEADARVDGKLTWDKKKFPKGIPALADYVHSKGLKLGIYSCAGSQTCGGKPASYGYEDEDAKTFASWKIDFLKYDNCFIPPGASSQGLYKRMGQALRNSGRDILFSMCEWGQNKSWEWGANVGGHMWRTTGDIFDNWKSIVDIGFTKQATLHPYAGPGHWNDPDMLVVGMYGKGNVAYGGCTDAEYRSHFSLWALLSSPLMIGCDVRHMNKATKEILLNKKVLAVNQDPLGRQAYPLGKAWLNDKPLGSDIWVKPLADGSIAVGIFNLGKRPNQWKNAAWESIGIHDRTPCRVENLWTGEDLGEHSRNFAVAVESHDVCLIRIRPS